MMPGCNFDLNCDPYDIYNNSTIPSMNGTAEQEAETVESQQSEKVKSLENVLENVKQTNYTLRIKNSALRIKAGVIPRLQQTIQDQIQKLQNKEQECNALMDQLTQVTAENEKLKVKRSSRKTELSALQERSIHDHTSYHRQVKSKEELEKLQKENAELRAKLEEKNAKTTHKKQKTNTYYANKATSTQRSEGLAIEFLTNARSLPSTNSPKQSPVDINNNNVDEDSNATEEFGLLDLSHLATNGIQETSVCLPHTLDLTNGK